MTIYSAGCPTVLLDADAIIYPIGFVAASNGFDAAWACEQVGKKYEMLLASLYEQGITKYHPTMCSYFTGSGSPKYRDQFHNVVPYKAKRKLATRTKPQWISEMIDHVGTYGIGSVGVSSATWGEADDEIARDARLLREEDVDYIIVHTDKDLNQIPGLHVNLKDPSKFYSIDTVMGLRCKYGQILSGDSADDIPGLPGWGKVKAYDLVMSCDSETELFDKTLEKYIEVMVDKGQSMDFITDYYYETANLVHLRTAEDDCWSPP